MGLSRRTGFAVTSLAAAALGAPLAVGCSGSSHGNNGGGSTNAGATTTGATTTPIDMAGNYSGSEDIAYGTHPANAYSVNADFTQQGAAISGSFVNNGGGIGTIDGTVNGATFTFTGTQSVPAGATLQGSGTISTVNGATMLSGSGNGNDPNNGPFTFSFAIHQ